jgi:hypothetical protein
MGVFLFNNFTPCPNSRVEQGVRKNILYVCVAGLACILAIGLQLFSTFCKIFLDRNLGVVILGIIE